MSSSYQYGRNAEYLACSYLESQGYDIISERYKTPHGEIDITAVKEGVVSFVEVKGRRNGFASGVDDLNLSTKQMKRNSDAASIFMRDNAQYQNYKQSFDLILLSGKTIMNHIKNAWFYDGQDIFVN